MSIKKAINPNYLKPGDIILTRSKRAGISLLIRVATFSKYSHAAIYVGRNTIVEAVASGVRTQNILRWSEGLMGNCLVLRYPDSAISKIAALQCETYQGSRYSALDAILAGISAYFFITFPFKVKNSKLFCSRMIAQAYSKFGAALTNRHYQIARPKDIERSPKLNKATVTYIDQTQHEPINYTEKFEDATTDLIKSCIKLMKSYKIKYKDLISIANFIDIADKNRGLQDFDRKLAELIKGSQFYNLWRQEQKDNPKNWEPNFYFKEAQTNRDHVLKKMYGIQKVHMEKIDQLSKEILAFKEFNKFKGHTFQAIFDLRNNLFSAHSGALRDFNFAIAYLEK